MIRERTNISTQNMPAVTAPPTKIEDNEMKLDPKQVIAAWLASAEVLREVAEAVRENQEDNEFIRESMRRNRQWLLITGVLITLLQVGSVGLVLRETTSAGEKVGTFLTDQGKTAKKISEEARETREEASELRKESRVVTSAVAAVLDASLAKEAQAADVEERMATAEATVAIAQAQVTTDPVEKERATDKAREATKRAVELKVEP